jgi:hypothetical protein
MLFAMPTQSRMQSTHFAQIRRDRVIDRTSHPCRTTRAPIITKPIVASWPPPWVNSVNASPRSGARFRTINAKIRTQVFSNS